MLRRFLRRVRRPEVTETPEEVFDINYSDFDTLGGLERLARSGVVDRIDALSDDSIFFARTALRLGEPPIVLFEPLNGHYNPRFWYRGEVEDAVLVIDNDRNFMGSLTNLPDLLRKATEVMEEAYARGKPIHPFGSFGVKLVDDIRERYQGRGELVFLTGAPLEGDLERQEEAAVFYANIFLDVFLGWNYGEVIRTDARLQGQAETLHHLLVRDGRRTAPPNRHEILSNVYMAEGDAHFYDVREAA